VEHDLVLLFRDIGSVHRPVHVRLRDGLTLDPDLFALNRDGLLHLFGDYILLEAGASPLLVRGADAELLLGARHCLVGGRTRDVVAQLSLVVGCFHSRLKLARVEEDPA
jgi:hypothetical protein